METPATVTNLTDSSTDPNRPNGSISIGQALLILGVLLLWSIPFSIPELVLDEYDIDLYGVPELLAFAGSMYLTIRYAQRKNGFDTPDLNPADSRTLPPMAYPFLIVGTLALAFLIEPLSVLIPTPDWLAEVLKETFTYKIILSAVLGAPLFEEWLFRGTLLRGFLKRYSPTSAIVWSAALFGLIHLNPAQSIGAFILGLALGWLYLRTGSLWPCIVLHFANNLFSSLLFLFTDTLDMTRNTTLDWFGNTVYYAGFLVVCGLAAALCYRGLDRILPQANVPA